METKHPAQAELDRTAPSTNISLPISYHRGCGWQQDGIDIIAWVEDAEEFAEENGQPVDHARAIDLVTAWQDAGHPEHDALIAAEQRGHDLFVKQCRDDHAAECAAERESERSAR